MTLRNISDIKSKMLLFKIYSTVYIYISLNVKYRWTLGQSFDTLTCEVDGGMIMVVFLCDMPRLQWYPVRQNFDRGCNLINYPRRTHITVASVIYSFWYRSRVYKGASIYKELSERNLFII